MGNSGTWVPTAKQNQGEGTGHLPVSANFLALNSDRNELKLQSYYLLSVQTRVDTLPSSSGR